MDSSIAPLAAGATFGHRHPLMHIKRDSLADEPRAVLSTQASRRLVHKVTIFSAILVLYNKVPPVAKLVEHRELRR